MGVTGRYEVEVLPRVLKVLESLPRRMQQRIREATSLLAENPLPRGGRKLEGAERTYRVHVGDYRVIYEIYDDRLVVTVVKIWHRSEAYRSRSGGRG